MQRSSNRATSWLSTTSLMITPVPNAYHKPSLASTRKHSSPDIS